MSLVAGDRVGPYQIQSVVGAGGMGVVYRAHDPRLNRLVAIKLLSGDLANDEQFQERFSREARAISSLEHPHIGAIYDVGIHDGAPYLVMQYLEGETLAARLTRGSLPLRQALTLGIELADALAAAHDRGIVHRDVKPANVMLTKSGTKLLDFGLAKERARVAAPAETAVTGSTSLQADPLTGVGTILGTFHYMSPEQLRGADVDVRTDIFSLGALLYEALSGHRPFDAPDTASVIAGVLEKEPTALRTALAVPPRLERTVMTCLEKDPADRWQSTRDLLRELRWIAEERSDTRSLPAAAPTSRRRWLTGAIGAAILLLLTLAAASWGLLSTTPAIAGPPTIVLMDSQHPARVYDEVTRKAGGTNADDLTDVLRDLPVVLLKENTGSSWHREDQVVAQNPAAIVMHRSAFYDATMLGDGLDETFRERLYAAPADKLDAFLGYVALANPRTHFIVYSRRGWATDAERLEWVRDVERRFPATRGRLTSFQVPLDRPTFRNPQTAAEIRQIVVEHLGLARNR